MLLRSVKSAILKQLINGKKKSSPLSIEQANAGLARVHLSEYIQMSDFSSIGDSDVKNYMFSAIGDDLFVGFGIQLHGFFLQAGNKVATEIETILKTLPVDSVVHTCEFAWDGYFPNLDLWFNRQAKYCKDKTILKMNSYRRKLLRDSAYVSIHKSSGLKLRSIDRYLFVTMPFKGSISNHDELEMFLENVVQVKNSVMSAAEQARLGPGLMNRTQNIRLLRKLLNPHMLSEELDQSNLLPDENDSLPFDTSLPEILTDKATSLEVLDDGALIFSGASGKQVAAMHLTVDKYPNHLVPGVWGSLTGNLYNRDERIRQPYYFYTNIHIVDPDRAREKVEVTMSWLNKQAKESSDTMKKLIPHIYERSNHSQRFLSSLVNGAIPVRMYSGIILYCEPKSAVMDAEKLVSSWASKGVKVSGERHIAFPMFNMSLPYQYMADWDEPRAGISRAKLCESINAASVFPITADGVGNVPTVEVDPEGKHYLYSNGIPLVTGRGNVAYFDLFKSPTNYNFSIIATSGAGKSFFANDMIRDMRSRNGMCFVIDMGGSYTDICEIFGGTNLTFPPGEPFSINPFWGIQNETEFRENFEALSSCVATMAFRVNDGTNAEVSAIENGLTEAYHIYKDKLGLKEIYEYFIDYERHGNSILPTVAALIERFAVGPDRYWFNGEPQADLSNPFTILELNELANSQSLKRVVFATILMLITRRMYSLLVEDRSTPKLLLIDEAWALLDDDSAAPFIEKAFRTIRKFMGAAGFITQSCADIAMSRASKAAFSNSAWKIFLAQKGDSISVLREQKLLGSAVSDLVADVLEGIRRRDNFSEVVIESDGAFSPYRFFVDRYSSFVYSSKAQDNALISKISQEKGLSRADSIEHLAGLRND